MEECMNYGVEKDIDLFARTLKLREHLFSLLPELQKDQSDKKILVVGHSRTLRSLLVDEVDSSKPNGEGFLNSLFFSNC